MKLTCEQQQLVMFASKISKKMGAQLAVLLRFGVVGTTKSWEFAALVNHLQTNRDFGLVTGFDFNIPKGLIWMDTLDKSLKMQFKKPIR